MKFIGNNQFLLISVFLLDILKHAMGLLLMKLLKFEGGAQKWLAATFSSMPKKIWFKHNHFLQSDRLSLNECALNS